MENDRHFSRPGSTTIAPQPHNKAGLTYTTTSPITTRYLYRPVQGRIITDVSQKKMSQSRTGHYMMVGIGGMTGRLSKIDAAGRATPQLDNPDAHKQPLLLKARRFTLWDPPRVVGAGATDGFKETNVQLDVVNYNTIRGIRDLPYLPGSQKYVAYKPTKSHKTAAHAATSARARYRRPLPRSKPPTPQAELLQTLDGMIPPVKA